MSSWQELAQQFGELEPAMENARLERQWDERSDDWSLAGGVNLEAARRFHALAASAGSLLADLAADVPPEVAAETDPETRWFRALWHMGGPHDPPVVGMMSLHGGAAGQVSSGRVRRPARASAALALRLKTPQGA